MQQSPAAAAPTQAELLWEGGAGKGVFLPEGSCWRSAGGDGKSAQHQMLWKRGQDLLQDSEHSMAQQEENSEPVLSGLGKKDSRDGKGCKWMTSGTRRKVAAPLSDQQLQDRFSTMMSHEGLGVVF